MKVYTSYFGNIKKLEEAGVLPVNISLYPPRWRKWVHLKMFAPTKDILFNTSGKEEYTRRFNSEILGRLDPNEIKQIINLVSQGKDIALLCFERPNDFCHRHLVADWIKEKLGIEVTEFDGTEKKGNCSCNSEQLTLF